MTSPTPQTNSTQDVVGAVRDLASALNQQPAVQPSTMVTGQVTAVSLTTSPPTISLTMSGSSTVIDGVRFLESYSPVVGDKVALAKQGTEICALGAYAVGASGWVKPTLGSGFTHNGDSQGDVNYRICWDNGSLKAQWKGAVGRSVNTTILASGVLPSTVYPSSKRKLIAPRDYSGGSIGIQIIFNTDGSVVLDGATFTSPTIALGTSGGSGDVHDHSHGGAVAEVSFVETHTHALGTATFAIAVPSWVSFNGLEYFL